MQVISLGKKKKMVTSYVDELSLLRSAKNAAFCLLGMVLLYCWPLLVEASRGTMLFIDTILISIIAVSGLNLLMGFGGLISLGHAAFVGVGAYSLVPFIQVFGDDHAIFVTYWPALILFCGFTTALVSTVIGLPSLRLKGLYLGLATLAFQMIFEWVVSRTGFLGRGDNINISTVRWLGSDIDRAEHYRFWYWVVLTFCVVLGFAKYNLIRSKFGRSLIAVRDNDRAACAMGMNPARTKLLAFFLSGFFAGIAGGLSGFVNRGVTLPSYNFLNSIEYLTMTIIGGPSTFIGSFIGPIAIKSMHQAVEGLTGKIGEVLGTTSDFSTPAISIAFGTVILLFALFSKSGLGLAGVCQKAMLFIKSWPFKA